MDDILVSIMARLSRVCMKHMKTLFFMYVIGALCLVKVAMDISLLRHLPRMGFEDLEAARGRLHPNATTNSRQTTDKVLIITYQRSGSSFLAELFNQNPHAYYLFEPLWGFYNSVDKDKVEYMLYYPDKSTRRPPERGLEYNMSVNIIHELFTCHMDRIPMQILAPKGVNHAFFTDENRHKYQDKYKKCILKARTRTKDVDCVPLMTEVCKNSTVKAFKMLRLRMKHVAPLMEQNPGLKIIHLVRDPRGILWSRRRLGTHYFRRSTENEGSILCLSMLQDIQAREQIESNYPGRSLQLRYEDYAAKPISTALRVYDFLGLHVPTEVLGWLLDGIAPSQASTDKFEARKRLRRMGSSFGTVRKDPKKTAHQWLKQMPKHMAHEADEYCKEVLDLLGYDSVSKLLNNETLLRSLGPDMRRHNIPGNDRIIKPANIDGKVVVRKILPAPVDDHHGDGDDDDDDDEDAPKITRPKSKIWKITKNSSGKKIVVDRMKNTRTDSKTKSRTKQRNI